MADRMDKSLTSESYLLNKFHIFLYDLHHTHDEPNVDWGRHISHSILCLKTYNLPTVECRISAHSHPSNLHHPEITSLPVLSCNCKIQQDISGHTKWLRNKSTRCKHTANTFSSTLIKCKANIRFLKLKGWEKKCTAQIKLQKTSLSLWMQDNIQLY